MLWRLLIGGFLGGVLVTVARAVFMATQPERPAGEPFDRRDAEAEPVLGYDGMERDDVVDWLDRARPDTDTLRHIATYERLHRNRIAVLEKVHDMMNGSAAPPSDRQDDQAPEGPEGATEEI